VNKFFEEVEADLVLYDTALDTGAGAVPTDPFVSLSDWRKCGFVIAAGGAPAPFTAQVLEATDAAGSGAQALGDPVTVTVPGGGTVLGEVEVRADELSEGFSFVGLLLDGPNTISASVVALRHAGRYLPPAED